MVSAKQGKIVVSNHPLPTHQGSVSSGAKSRLVRVGKVVHPCKVLIFLKSRVHGYGQLGNGCDDHRELEPNRKTWQVK